MSLHWLLPLLFISLPVAIEHDSICTASNCPPPTHIVMRTKRKDDRKAAEIAAEHGLKVVGRPFLDDHYFLAHLDENLSERSKREIEGKLRQSEHVNSVEEHRARRRVKRDNVEDRRQKRAIPNLPWSDPLYRDQWYLHGGAVGSFDMNVREAWLLGYSGKNVSVSILDDGIQRDHLDLNRNYDPLASSDINDHDDDPMPQNNGDNKHGTRCAGEVASIAANDQCGVGVAYDAMIGGVRMLDGPVSDSVEAAALSLNQDHIDIYSASWGPEDDGKTFDGPGPLARQAFYRGIKEGRQGKGNIFVWASGNGGSRQDSCSADGYTTSVYTLSISSATFDNQIPWYLEECPSTIASTYSSANYNQPAIVTVDVPRGCTMKHTGTSASAPLAAGIIALALEANPSLTWRDMQHIVLRTANPKPLLNEHNGWSLNGVGRKISSKFGYGMMDGGELAKLAKIWQPTPEQHICTYDYRLSEPNPRPLTGQFQLNFTLSVGGCQRGTPVLYLEHVQVLATCRYGKRGDLKLTLFSPSGTQSVILPPRPQDFNTNGFHKWPFLTVQMWGEDPRGEWTLMVESVSVRNDLAGTFHDWSLLLYGSQTPAQPSDPIHVDGETFISTSQISEGVSQTWTSIESPESVANCHIECDGCYAPRSSTECFKCKHLSQARRNRAGVKCVSVCETGYFQSGSDCKMCSVKCKTCSKSEICKTCHGAQLLIDVDHYGHFDHGQCVIECPQGLVSDYDSNLLQPKCILKKNPCVFGYYFASLDGEKTGKCLQCHSACSKCHGPGPLQCDLCALHYGNKSAGYCRPCCESGQMPEIFHCDNCNTTLPSFFIFSSFRSGIVSACIFAVVFFVICFACLMFRDRKLEQSGVSYFRLPVRYDISSESKIGGIRGPLVNGISSPILITDSDSEDGIFEKEDYLGR